MKPSIHNDPFSPSLSDSAPGGQLVEESPPFLEYAQLLWYRKWTVIAITLLAGVAGWVWANQQTPIYRAQSSMMIGTSSVTAISPDMAWYVRKQAPDEIQVLTSRNMADKVVKRLDLLSYPEFNPGLRVPREPGLFDWFRPRDWVPDSWKDIFKAAMNREPQQQGMGLSLIHI